MALQNMRGIGYMETENTSLDVRISFVHEILRTREEKEFRNMHSHGKYYKIIWFNSGTRDIQIGSRVENCGPGDVVILTNKELYCGRSLDTFLDRYSLYVGENAFDIFGSYGKELMRLFTDYPPYTRNRFHPSPEEAAQMNALLVDIDKLIHVQADDPCVSMDAFANVIKLLVLVKQSRAKKHQIGAPSQLMLQILAYMESNYHRIESEEEICREFSISRSGLWRMFKQYMNQTPGEYLRRIRLENARHGLKDGKSVTDVSMECGFADSSHFIRLFRAAYGLTPYRYKKEHDLAGENGSQ